MAIGFANNFEIVSGLFHYLGRLSHNCLTAGICFKVGWMTHEHEIALSPIPPPQKRVLRF